MSRLLMYNCLLDALQHPAGFAAIDNTDKAFLLNHEGQNSLQLHCACFYVYDIAGGAASIDFYLSAGAGTDRKVTTTVTAALEIDATDATKGFARVDLSNHYAIADALADWVTDGLYLHMIANAGTCKVQPAIRCRR